MTRRHGSPYRNLEERLLANSFQDENGCWLWLGTKSRDGYGRISLWITGEGRRRVLQAHRLSYTVFIGEIPPGHDLDHSLGCLRCCIHPNHLVPKPYKEHRRLTLPKAVNTNPPEQLRLWGEVYAKAPC